jgi:hypothetical protein
MREVTKDISLADETLELLSLDQNGCCGTYGGVAESLSCHWFSAQSVSRAS